ncbi:MAG: hypothetical protein K2I73_04955 [Eubacterium sp.]|nr:hypothetical protein [Eubacterium sp.]
MAKQKKKRKRPHIRISKKSKMLFELAFLPLPIIALITLVFSNNLFYILVKLLFNKDALYCAYSFNGCTIVLFILLITSILLNIVWLSKATALKIEFKDYFSGKIEKAKKQIKSIIICSIVLSILFITFLCIQVPSRLVATTDKITVYHLKSEDTIMHYKDIESAKIEYRKGHLPLGRAGSSTITYDIVITIKVNNSEIEFHEDAFNNNYTNILSFLNCIDSSKITIDKTNTERYLAKTTKSKDAFKEIFELD